MNYAPGDRVICANCGRWRHEHYNRGGLWIADRYQENPCVEYYGIEPTGDQLVGLLEEQLETVKASIAANSR